MPNAAPSVASLALSQDRRAKLTESVCARDQVQPARLLCRVHSVNPGLLSAPRHPITVSTGSFAFLAGCRLQAHRRPGGELGYRGGGGFGLCSQAWSPRMKA